MHELRIRKRRAAVRVRRVDVGGVRVRRLDVEHEPEAPQQRVLKVVRGLALPVLGHALLDVRHGRGLHREPHGETRLERVAVCDVADGRDVGLDQRQPVTLDGASPHAQHVLDTSCRGADPMEFKVKDGRRVMNQIVMQYHRFCLVAFLFIKGIHQTGSEPASWSLYTQQLHLVGIHIDDHTLAQDDALLRLFDDVPRNAGR